MCRSLYRSNVTKISYTQNLGFNYLNTCCNQCWTKYDQILLGVELCARFLNVFKSINQC